MISRMTQEKQTEPQSSCFTNQRKKKSFNLHDNLLARQHPRRSRVNVKGSCTFQAGCGYKRMQRNAMRSCCFMHCDFHGVAEVNSMLEPLRNAAKSWRMAVYLMQEYSKYVNIMEILNLNNENKKYNKQYFTHRERVKR